MKTSEMSLEILKKNKEILENTQSRLKRWLKIIFDNVIFFSNEKQRLNDQFMSFDNYERKISDPGFNEVLLKPEGEIEKSNDRVENIELID
jgi:hypothetical protein